MLNKKWTVLSKNEQLINYFSKELSISHIGSHLLVNRGIHDINQAKKFFSPCLDMLSSPFKLKDIEKAISIINKKIKENAKIYIYGDYDVDGITSTCILYKVLHHFYKNINYYIPHRVSEGYGLNCEAIKKIKDSGASLIITVDCGITSIEEVAYAKKLGIDIIITDHHLPHEELPCADAIINPQQKDCTYPFKPLAGVGVAFQFAFAIFQTFSPNTPFFLVDELLALTALGTVADIVPLLDENRILVKFGLSALNNTKSPGLLNLIEISGLSNKKIDSEHIGFWLAPRLNACGRMHNAYMAIELLLTDDTNKACEIAHELNKLNQERQRLLDKTFEEAVSLIEKHIDLQSEQIIVLAWPGWHPGIIGLVASRLVEKYSRPAIVIAITNEEGKGSGRSVKNIDLFKIITECGHLLTKSGGHEQAIGLNIKKDNIKNFRKEINCIIKNIADINELESSLNIEYVIEPEEIKMELLEELEKFIPFGLGNPRPIFAFKNTYVTSTPKILKNKHLKFQVGKKGFNWNAICFNQADKFSLLSQNSIDLVFNLGINEWLGQKNINLEVREMGYDKI